MKNSENEYIQESSLYTASKTTGPSSYKNNLTHTIKKDTYFLK